MKSVLDYVARAWLARREYAMQTALSLSLDSESARSTAANTGATNSRLHTTSSTAVDTRTPASAGSRASPAQHTPAIRVRFDPGRRARKSDYHVKPAILGNHLAIQTFLQRQLHQPAKFEFTSLANRPGYDASQRLIIQHGLERELLAHVHVQPQVMRFGTTEMPIARLRHFAMFPEYRQQGYFDGLLIAAEAEAKRQGAMLCVCRGGDYNLLSKHGWVTIGNDPVSIVCPRRLLGQLPAPAVPESPFYAAQMPEYYVRIGRLTDLDAMRELYHEHVSSLHGTAVRDHAYWSWLMTRGSHHRVYIFFEDEEARAYVVVRNASILELVDSTDNGRGAARLLEQVGADAIDQGRYSLRIHSPIDDPVHRWADQADGRLYLGERDESWMVKVPSFRALLRRLAPEMFRRQRRQNVVAELSVRIGNEEIRIARGVRSMKITRGAASRHRIGLTQKAAAQLMLGYRSADQLADEQKLVASTDEAMRTIRVLLPALNLWRSEWDDAPVLGN